MSPLQKSHLWTASALFVPLLVWLAYPPKLLATFKALANSPYGPERFSADGLLFYPRLLPWYAGSELMAGLWGLVLITTVVAGVWRRDPRMRFLAVSVLCLAVIGELHQTKIDRHLLPLIPGCSLLLGYWAGKSFESLRSYGRPVYVAGAGLLSLSLLAAMFGAYRTISPDQPQATLGKVAAAVRPEDADGRTIFISTIEGNVTPAALDWSLIRAGLLEIKSAGSLVHPLEPQVAGVLRAKLPTATGTWAADQIDRWPGDSGSASIFVGLPLDYPEAVLTPANFKAQIAQLASTRPFLRIAVLLPASFGLYPQLTPAFVSGQLKDLGFAAPSEGWMTLDEGMLTARFRREGLPPS